MVVLWRSIVTFVHNNFWFFNVLLQGSKQKEFAEHATNTIRILPEINNLCEPLDEDIATFSLTDLGSLDAVVNDITRSLTDELGGSELQCHAINSPNTPLKTQEVFSGTVDFN
jgi:hypothetical protein